MNIKRGTPPAFIDRELVVDIDRAEILDVLTSYIKKKINNNNVAIDNIEVVASPDAQLESMTLTGVESIPLKWKETENRDVQNIINK